MMAQAMRRVWGTLSMPSRRATSAVMAGWAVHFLEDVGGVVNALLQIKSLGLRRSGVKRRDDEVRPFIHPLPSRPGLILLGEADVFHPAVKTQ